MTAGQVGHGGLWHMDGESGHLLGLVLGPVHQDGREEVGPLPPSGVPVPHPLLPESQGRVGRGGALA